MTWRLGPLALSTASIKPILWDGGWEGERRGVASQPTNVSFRANKNRWITGTVDGAGYRTGLAEKSYVWKYQFTREQTTRVVFQAGPTMIRPHPASREPTGERHKSTLGLHLLVSPELFSAGRLKIRCTASLHHLYSQSTEKSVEEDRPRAGPSYIYTAPPPPPEDRFTDYEDENQGEDISAAASSGGGSKSVKWTGNGAGTISILVLLFSLFSVT
uniref:Uncharacterized protein n=1 Tax=Timema genevievae TaxID=629358 RepID=A0A7R9JUI3_TIMGE|nr:unnamed protein product [Timema genevievae]